MALHRAIETLLRDVTQTTILPRFRNLAAGEIEDKGGNDPVTIADRESEAMLREGLDKIIPGLAFVGEEQVRILEEIVELDPLDGDALILLGRQAGRGGDVEQAVFYFERAANVEGFEADAKIRHGQLLVGQGRYQEALPLLRRAQQLAPRDNVQEYIEQVERFAQSR